MLDSVRRQGSVVSGSPSKPAPNLWDGPLRRFQQRYPLVASLQLSL